MRLKARAFRVLRWRLLMPFCRGFRFIYGREILSTSRSFWERHLKSLWNLGHKAAERIISFRSVDLVKLISLVMRSRISLDGRLHHTSICARKLKEVFLVQLCGEIMSTITWLHAPSTAKIIVMGVDQARIREQNFVHTFNEVPELDLRCVHYFGHAFGYR